MAINVNIEVPDIDTIITSYDQIKVYRSHYSTGPFVEITSSVEASATLLGRTTGPLFPTLNGKDLSIKTKNIPSQTVTFITADPINIANVVIECNAAFSGTTAIADADRLRLTSNTTGADELIQILNSSSLDELGFIAGEYATGKYVRIPLVGGTTTYLFSDINGLDTDFYKTQYYNTVTTTASEYSATFRPVKTEVFAEKQVESNAPRGLTLLRGTVHTFRHSFFEDTAKLTPMSPLDSGKYPFVTVTDIFGQVVQAGLATLDGVPGNYKFDFVVPQDAALSIDDRRWLIVWDFISNKIRQVTNSVEFDVKDPDIPDEFLDIGDSYFSHRLLAFPCKAFRVLFPLTKRPYSISLDVVQGGGGSDLSNATYLFENVIFPYDPINPQPNTLQLHESTAGPYYIYYFDIPDGCEYLKACMTYTMLWSVNPTILSPPQITYRTLDVIPLNLLPMISSLRELIDKYNKRRDLPQAYQDSQLYEYLKQGRNMVNSLEPPFTAFSFSNYPATFAYYLLLGSFIHGLQAQYLLENDLSFGFSGQTVTIDYDHLSAIDSALGRAMDLFREGLAKAKAAYQRSTTPVGVVAGRPISYRRAEHFVYRINTLESGDILGLLTKIGLL